MCNVFCNFFVFQVFIKILIFCPCRCRAEIFAAAANLCVSFARGCRGVLDSFAGQLGIVEVVRGDRWICLDGFGYCLITAASDRYDRSRDRSIESIGSIDSIIFRSFKIFGNSSWRRCGSNGPKIMKIRAILAIFWPFEDFCRKIRRPYRRRRKQWGGSGSSNRYHYSTPNIFYLFFKPLLGELRKKNEVTSRI